MPIKEGDNKKPNDLREKIYVEDVDNSEVIKLHHEQYMAGKISGMSLHHRTVPSYMSDMEFTTEIHVDQNIIYFDYFLKTLKFTQQSIWIQELFIDDLTTIYKGSDYFPRKKYVTHNGKLYFSVYSGTHSGYRLKKQCNVPSCMSEYLHECSQLSMLNSMPVIIKDDINTHIFENKHSQVIYNTGLPLSNKSTRKWKDKLGVEVHCYAFMGVYAPFGYSDFSTGEEVIYGNEAYLNELIGIPYTINSFDEIWSKRDIQGCVINGWYFFDRLCINSTGEIAYLI